MAQPALDVFHALDQALAAAVATAAPSVVHVSRGRTGGTGLAWAEGLVVTWLGMCQGEPSRMCEDFRDPNAIWSRSPIVMLDWQARRTGEGFQGLLDVGWKVQLADALLSRCAGVGPPLEQKNLFGRRLRLARRRHVVVEVRRQEQPGDQRTVAGASGAQHRAVVAAFPQVLEGVEAEAALLLVRVVAAGASAFPQLLDYDGKDLRVRPLGLISLPRAEVPRHFQTAIG